MSWPGEAFDGGPGRVPARVGHEQDCPECRQGQHGNCTGWAIDDNDEMVECECLMGGHA